MPGMEETMHEYKHGTLHSGSKRGPKVKSRAQAIAIGLSEQRREGKSVPKHHSGHKSGGEHRSGTVPSGMHGGGRHGPFGAEHNTGHHSLAHSELRSQSNERSNARQPRGRSTVGETNVAKHEGGPAAHTHVSAHHSPGSGKAEHHPPVSHEPHRFSPPHATGAHGFGHAAHQRHGALRMSGEHGAHRIGKR